MTHPLHELMRDSLDHCVKCTICETYCPVAAATPLFPGPKYVGPQAERYRGAGATADDSLDYCSSCGICTQVCPQGVKIAEINSQAKAALAQERGVSLRDKLIARPTLTGWMGAPVWPVANWTTAFGPFRLMLEKVLQIHRRAPMPRWAGRTFQSRTRGRRRAPNPAAPQRQVVFFHGCAANFYEPGTASMAVAVLEHNGLEVIVPKQGCCGLPLQSNGQYDAARGYVRRLAAQLAPYARAGHDIVATSTSCGLMLKREAKEILGVDDDDLAVVSERLFDICEYLVMRDERGELRRDMREVDMEVPYHAPCQQRGHGVGTPAMELMGMVPGLRARQVDAVCCGVAGTYGLKAEKYDIAMEVGRPLFDQVRASGAELSVCDSETCRWQIAAATERPSVHPVEILHRAYGLGLTPMTAVGLVIVSHSARLAEGVVELAREMAGADVPIAAAGGLDEPGDPIGTDAVRVMAAVQEVAAEGRAALVLMDLGSAVLSAETALDLLDEEIRGRTMLCEAPLVEGAVAAAAAARAGGSLEEVAREARNGLAGKAAHLGSAPEVPAAGADTAGDADWTGVEARVRGDAHGLHARPAAAVVRAAADRDAQVRIRNLTTGAGPADARSLTGLSALGVLDGHRILIEARGPEAARALEDVRALVEGGEGDAPAGATAPPAEPAAPSAARAPEPGEELGGVPSSPGLGAGPAVLIGSAPDLPDRPAGDPAAGRSALGAARAAVSAELERLRAGAARETADIIGAQILLLDDAALVGAAERDIGAGAPAARAWRDAARAAAATYERLDDPYLRARAADVLDVGRRVVAHLTGAGGAAAHGVLVAVDLGAAEVAALDPRRVTGLAMAGGGPTSHAAIIARALGIPAVTGLGPVALAIPEGTTLLLDGGTGIVTVAPSAETAGDHERRAREVRRRAERAAAHAHEPAVTRDGRTIEVAANIGAPGDLEAAVGGGADGVGLLRTEFLFLGRADAPGEAEQHRVYAEAVRRLDGSRLVLRTLDAGADKPLAYLDLPAEENPFLGVRGVRLSLRRPELLLVQLRAALRAAADGPVSVMFPMISELAEVRAARALLERARAELLAESLPSGEVEVGAMVEVPAAALLADALAAELDFLSVGTNDLVQYTMAAERGNAGVAGLSDPLHPAVLRLIARVCEAGAANDCRVAVCGEAASDLAAVPILVGLGVDELSVTPLRVGLVKEAVRALEIHAARGLAEAALEMIDAASVRRRASAGTVGG